MKIFIWQSVDKCSDNYPKDGGVVVFAEDEEHARRLANAREDCSIRADELPDVVRNCSDDGPYFVRVFPNAGCC